MESGLPVTENEDLRSESGDIINRSGGLVNESGVDCTGEGTWTNTYD